MGALSTKGTIRKKQIYLKFGQNILKKNEVLKRCFSVSQSLACSLNRINAADKDTREGKTEGSGQRLTNKAAPQLGVDPGLFTSNVLS